MGTSSLFTDQSNNLVQGGDGAGFAFKPRLEIWIVGDMLGQHLDGEFPRTTRYSFLRSITLSGSALKMM